MKNKKQKVEQQIPTNFDNMNSDSDEDDEGHFDLLSHSIQEEEENLINERNRMFYYYYRMDVKNIEKLLDERGIIFNSGLNETKKCQLLLGVKLLNFHWYLTLFWYIIECYIVNSFVVHQNYNKYRLSYREFRKTILEDLNGHQTLRKYAPSSTFSIFSTFFQIFQRKNNEKS
ncbi:hypothetical protein ACTFIW_006749 [Dictyostelium discoideum]